MTLRYREAKWLKNYGMGETIKVVESWEKWLIHVGDVI
jgi:hypothetical protein